MNLPPKYIYPYQLPMYCDECKSDVYTDGKFIWCKCRKEKAHFLVSKEKTNDKSV